MYHFQEHLKLDKGLKEIIKETHIVNSETPIVKKESNDLNREKVNSIHFTDQLYKLNINKP